MVRLFEEMVCYARQSGCYERSDMRQKLADLAIDLEAMKMCALEENWKLAQKIAVVSEPARNKALYDRILEKISRLGTEIILS
jgi:alkylation response protein AidB-like acyl-CoA dehydrogenase